MSEQKKLLAKCIDNAMYRDQLTVGKIYEVTFGNTLSGEKFFKFTGDDDCVTDALQRRFEVIEEEVKVTEFKTGDKVRVIGNSNTHRRKIGDICYLVNRSTGRIGSWESSSTIGGSHEEACYLRESDIELVTEVPTETTKVQFKVGDEVKIRKDSQYYGRNRTNPAGVVGTIKILESDDGDEVITVMWPNIGTNSYRSRDLEHADMEIAPEPEIPSKWANCEIGYY